MKWLMGAGLLACCGIFWNARAADELEMLNGSKMNGKLVAETPDAITFNSGGAELKLDVALIRAISVDGVRRELQASAGKKTDAKPAVAAAKSAPGEGADPARPKTLLDATPELRRKLLTDLDDAKREAREKIKAGTEKALEKYPKMSPEMAQLMRSPSTQATWLKVIVDGAFKFNQAHTSSVVDLYASCCESIRHMRDPYSGLEGAAFIDDYVAEAIRTSVGVLPPDKPADGKAPPKHLVHRIQDNSGISQLGGN